MTGGPRIPLEREPGRRAAASVVERRLDRLRAFYAERGLTPHPFQEETWRAAWASGSGLVQVSTGAGKTWAAFCGPLMELADEFERDGSLPDALRVIHVTPLRAVANDIARALQAPAQALGLPLRIETRTGDTPDRVRRRQRENLPHVLVTTPESLAVLLTRDEAPALLRHVGTVVLDEWHELMGTKRGCLLELSLTRVRAVAGNVRTWALSATVGNPQQALRTAVGASGQGRIVRGDAARPLVLDTLVPSPVEAFPWAGHMGLRMLPEVLRLLDAAQGTTLVFTNTRNQAENWFHAILDQRLEWAGAIALHHGSLDRANRAAVEEELRAGRLRLVVATSSLDLGVDFATVERVIQVGSIKGVARLLQRAGRSAHRPGGTMKLHCVPTHALQLLEVAAARRAIEAGAIEAPTPLDAPLDVLAQHMVTAAIGGGFHPAHLFDEVCEAASFADLSRASFDWVLRLLRDGGDVLRRNPEYHRLVEDEDGLYTVEDPRQRQRHRMGIGTIVSDAQVEVAFRNGRRLGTVEERFIAGLRPGDTFLFAGRVVRFDRLEGLVARVVAAGGAPATSPRWAGGRLPLSSCLAEHVRETLGACREGGGEGPEVEAARPVLRAQEALSVIPDRHRVLAECWQARDGAHLFVYPFEGRVVHEGLGALLALRLSRWRPATFAIAVNDHGIELLGPRDWPFGDALAEAQPFGREALEEDVEESVNLSELARRHFREVARISQLVFEGFPGARRSNRHLQSSAGLLWDVFVEHDPGNLLVAQAREEVLARSFDLPRLVGVLDRVERHGIEVRHIERPTPLAFPLVVERMRNRVGSETLEDRLRRMVESWDGGAR